MVVTLAIGCHPKRSEGSRRSLDFLKAARFIDIEHHAELEALIEDFDLEFWGAEKVEEMEEEKPP